MWISKRIAIAEFHTAYIGIRLSPVIQFGRIVSLFPVDNTPVPNGFQTDVIGTGGSSGSAIVDSKGDVVGIALEVFGADVMEGNESTRYTARVRLVYGLTTNMLNAILNNVVDFFERNIKDIPYSLLQQPFILRTFGDFDLLSHGI